MDKSSPVRPFFIRSALLCKHLIKMPVIPVMLILIPVFTFILSNFSGTNASSGVTAGLYFALDDEWSAALSESLCGREDAFSFLCYDDIDELKNDVLLGTIECGYIFDEDFARAIEKKHYANCVKVVRSPATVFNSAANEIIFSELIRLSGYSIIGEYVRTEGIAPKDEEAAKDYLFEAYEAYCGSGATFHLDIVTAGGISINDDGKTSLGITFPLRGILSILIFLAGMLGSAAWLKDKELGIFAPRSVSFRITSRILYPLLPALLFLLCSELSLHISKSALSLTDELFLALRYLALITVFCNLCISILGRSSLVISLIPVLVLGSLIFCPVFVNIESFVPALKFVSRLFLPRYFL